MNLEQALKICSGSSERCGQTSSPVRDGEFLEQLSEYQLLKKGLCSVQLVALIVAEGRSSELRAGVLFPGHAPVLHAASRISALSAPAVCAG
jgi:hypothetical protein